MVFDYTEPRFDEKAFEKFSWETYYPDAQEEIPSNMPEARGKPVTLTCFVDADHAGCKETRRSHTGILLWLNKAPVMWHSKRQSTVESSTFGSEFVVMRTANEMIKGLWYKLRMMGVEINGPCNLFCDNDSVVMNTMRPESVLKKKHNAICYHLVREAIASNTIRIAREDTKPNMADMLTKCLLGPLLQECVSRVLW